MMPYDKWLDCIVEGARHIASREYQEEAWLVGGEVKSSPDEIYLVLMEDCTADLFFQTYGESLTDAQRESWRDLRLSLQEYHDRMPPSPDPREILNDPSWDLVRQSAGRFVSVFGVD